MKRLAFIAVLLSAAVFWPPVITFAMPRPAIIITKVVMKGCRPT